MSYDSPSHDHLPARQTKDDRLTGSYPFRKTHNDKIRTTLPLISIFPATFNEFCDFLPGCTSISNQLSPYTEVSRFRLGVFRRVHTDEILL
ncbi:MAG: hypothetical protein CM1200mP18_01660 [Gammaproteobacteria bacterium]|nr:MAG: hypothetical protein CM1200mP18_01660 [Gammaproteobacteria bacterium]